MGSVERPTLAVEIDAASLTGEADVLAAASPAEPAAAPAGAPSHEPGATVIIASESPEAIASQAAPLMGAALFKAGRMFAPNWEITKAEADETGEALALALAYWLPQGAIEPKWMALISLGMSAYNIAEARIDSETGAIRPLRDKKKPQQEQAQSATASPAQPMSL